MKTHNLSSDPLSHSGVDAAPHPDVVAQQAAENEGWPVAPIAPSGLFYATPWRWYFRAEPVDSVQDARSIRVRNSALPGPI